MLSTYSIVLCYTIYLLYSHWNYKHRDIMRHCWFSPGRLLAIVLAITTLLEASFGVPVSETHSEDTVHTLSSQSQTSSSAGDFPVCTDRNTEFSPFCLPHDGAEVIVDATYYVTWNADLYPLNATITIELRYPNSTEGDSAFTSERTDNSYGYVPLRMRKEWLQGKSHNRLTLYSIELDSTSDRRASARQGPTVVLLPRPAEHYKPPPSLPFNKLALMIGLPVSVGVVVLLVCAVSFGMWRSRKTGIKHIRASRNKGYGVGKSKNQRMEKSSGFKSADMIDIEADALAAMKKYSDVDEGMSMSEMADRDLYHDVYRPTNYGVGTRVSRLKSWSG